MSNLALCTSLLTLCWFNDPVTIGIAEDRVDLIELNHFYDDRGKLIFDQVIFYNWSEPDARFMVRDWRSLNSSSQYPIADGASGEFIVVWYDDDLLRVVRCAHMRESWTRHDPELAERNFLPQQQRAKLSRPLDLRPFFR